MTTPLTPLDDVRALAQDISLFALVDGGLLIDAPRAIRLQFPLDQGHSLFKGVTDPEAIEIGPLLFEITLPHQIEHLDKLLIDSRRGVPVASLIVSEHDAATLAALLADFVDVRLDSGTEMVMRFYDPRILPFWWEQIAPAYRQRLSDHITTWLMPDQRLQMRPLPMEKTMPTAEAPAIALKHPMQLTQEQEFALMDASAPYTLAERFRDKNPDALARLAPETRYDFFASQTKKALSKGVPEGYAVESFCKLTLQYGEHFDSHPHLKSVFEAIKNGTRFEEAMQDVTPLQWLDIESQAQTAT